MKRFIAASLFFAALTMSPARAWNDDGHQLVGSIADQLLEGTNAKDQVQKYLGFELRVAAVWPDCVRSVRNKGDGQFEFEEDPRHPEYTANCPPFEEAAEKERMQDYARRNWFNCVYIKGLEEKRGCHEAYHFTDVPVQRDDYKLGYAGTSTHDVVSAINAAIAVLKDQQRDTIFSIKDKKEALFLLAHFVGDMHEPLHVGAVYLDGGTLVDPATPADVKEETETQGGNALFYDGSEKLHVFWDTPPEGMTGVADADMIARARAVPTTQADLDELAARWATDTITASHAAYKGLSYEKADERRWNIAFEDRDDYFARADELKRDQLAKGGARLAELLKAIWP